MTRVTLAAPLRRSTAPNPPRRARDILPPLLRSIHRTKRLILNEFVQEQKNGHEIVAPIHHGRTECMRALTRPAIRRSIFHGHRRYPTDMNERILGTILATTGTPSRVCITQRTLSPDQESTNITHRKRLPTITHRRRPRRRVTLRQPLLSHPVPGLMVGLPGRTPTMRITGP